MMTLTICVANIDINSLQCKSSNSYIYQLRGCWCCCDLALPWLALLFSVSLILSSLVNIPPRRWAAATSACAVQRGLGLMVVWCLDWREMLKCWSQAMYGQCGKPLARHNLAPQSIFHFCQCVSSSGGPSHQYYRPTLVWGVDWDCELGQIFTMLFHYIY